MMATTVRDISMRGPLPNMLDLAEAVVSGGGATRRRLHPHALSCNLSDADLAGRFDLLVRGNEGEPASAEDEDSENRCSLRPHPAAKRASNPGTDAPPKTSAKPPQAIRHR